MQTGDKFMQIIYQPASFKGTKASIHSKVQLTLDQKKETVK